MEVHPPEHTIHTWRDFFVHIATIVVGLLIAIGLEQSVEALHRRHLLHEAEAKLNEEFHDNRKLLAGDLQEVAQLRKDMQDNIAFIQSLQAHTPGEERKHIGWEWSDLTENAWDTAHGSGALALMEYTSAQAHDDLYRQATLVNNQAVVVFRDLFTYTAPLEGGRKLRDLKPAELDAMVVAARQTLVDLNYLNMLANNLDRMYHESEGKL